MTIKWMEHHFGLPTPVGTPAAADKEDEEVEVLLLGVMGRRMKKGCSAPRSGAFLLKWKEVT